MKIGVHTKKTTVYFSCLTVKGDGFQVKTKKEICPDPEDHPGECFDWFVAMLNALNEGNEVKSSGVTRSVGGTFGSHPTSIRTQMIAFLALHTLKMSPKLVHPASHAKILSCPKGSDPNVYADQMLNPDKSLRYWADGCRQAAINALG